MASSLLLVLFNVYLLLNLMDFVVLLKSDFINENPLIQLSVSPNVGYSTENIEVRCEITPPSTTSPLSSLKFDNIYLSVKTDSVKPSGILLQFEDSTDRCLVIPEKKFHIDICNSTLIRIHINHTILNDTIQKIDYVCSKGNTYVSSSYQIIHQSARYYDPRYNSSSSSLTHTYLLLFVVFITTNFFQWS